MLYTDNRQNKMEVTDLKGLPGEAPHYYFVTDPDGYKVEIIRS